VRIGKTEKPTFIQVRRDFLALIERECKIKVTTEQVWTELADTETRERIIKEFIKQMEQQYGFEIVLKSSLKDKEGLVEGVVGELYHVFSTMFLVEAINSKLRVGERRVEIE
jgi:hypothetical protein